MFTGFIQNSIPKKDSKEIILAYSENNIVVSSVPTSFGCSAIKGQGRKHKTTDLINITLNNKKITCQCYLAASANLRLDVAAVVKYV